MMSTREIVAELEDCARWEARGIHALETTRFEPELDEAAQSAIASSRRRVAALLAAIVLLRDPPLAAPSRLELARAWLLRLRLGVARTRSVLFGEAAK